MERTQGIITRLTKLTDSSLIVHLVTQDQGVVKVVAKGARRPKSPFAGRLDLFFTVDFVFAHSKFGELHYLREATPVTHRLNLRKDYISMLLASYCCRVLESCVEPSSPIPLLSDLLQRALDHIDAEGASLRAFQHYERELARLQGLPYKKGRYETSLRDILGNFPTMRAELLKHL